MMQSMENKVLQHDDLLDIGSPPPIRLASNACTRSSSTAALDDSADPRRTRGLLMGIYRLGVAHEAGRPQPNGGQESVMTGGPA